MFDLSSVGLFFRQIYSHKKRVLAMNPHAKSLYVRNWATIVLYPTGVPITAPNYKHTWCSYLPLFVCLNIVIFGAYTIGYYWAHKSYGKCLNVMCLSGITFSVHLQIKVIKK